MVTARLFVAALLEEISRARELSDRASVRVAQSYLRDEFLRGFPVPRMQIGNLEMELNFMLASKVREATHLEGKEVQKNVSYQLRSYLHEMPRNGAFKTYFRSDAELSKSWLHGLDDVTRRFQQVLEHGGVEHSDIVHNLCLAVHNYFHESSPPQLRSTIADLLAKSRGKGNTGAYTVLIAAHVEEVMASVRAPAQSDEESSSDVNLLIGAAELEKYPAALLQKMKLTISHADRRWVITDQNGTKVHVLGT